MVATTDIFRSRFPEFSDDVEFPDIRIQLFLDDAVALYIGSDENRWCNRYDIAHAYLSAHLLTIGTNTEVGDSNSKSGSISSKSAGGVSVSRAIPSKDRSDTDDFFITTAYGQQFLIIRNSCFAGVLVANSL